MKRVAQELVKIAKLLSSYRTPSGRYVPDGATKYQNKDIEETDLEIWVEDGMNSKTGRPYYYGIAYVGRANKSLWNHLFRDELQRENIFITE